MSTALLLGYAPIVVAAEDLPREAVLPLSLATTAASAALDQCAKDGYRVSVAVVDRAGVVRALMRGDGAGPHTVKSSVKKAYTAASLRGSTGDVAEMITKMPATQGLRDMNEKVLILEGDFQLRSAEKSSAESVSGARARRPLRCSLRPGRLGQYRREGKIYSRKVNSLSLIFRQRARSHCNSALFKEVSMRRVDLKPRMPGRLTVGGSHG